MILLLPFLNKLCKEILPKNPLKVYLLIFLGILTISKNKKIVESNKTKKVPVKYISKINQLL
ncbi:hypothetical protein AWE51_16405 [Aquimarina aggregata]|uniref:Uncharacterized protein n=1 Tax=Aquimarina aggregata TaxID=1642818 RepID=A0A163D1X8_9FLAO|nr:hypothetical protein AWE51_16405 [Aquimarina aggregata]